MNWLKDNWMFLLVGVLLVAGVIAFFAFGGDWGIGGKKPAPPVSTVLEPKNGVSYQVTGDITGAGIVINENELKKALQQSDQEAYRSIVASGTAGNFGKAATPSWFANETKEMFVAFKITDGNKAVDVRVATGAWEKTLSYFLSLRNSPWILYRAGEPTGSSAMPSLGKIPRNVTSTIQGTIVGTPYNFIPLPVANQPADATVRDINIPALK